MSDEPWKFFGNTGTRQSFQYKDSILPDIPEQEFPL